MSESDEYRALVMREVAHHLKIYGPRDWEKLQEKHPKVNKRTFFRWVKRVREGEVIPEILEPAIKAARVEALKHLPAAPAPEYLAKEGAAGARQLDFLSALGDLYQDAEQLRDFSTHELKDGEVRRKIKNPILFDTAIKRRLDLIGTAIKVQQEIYNLQRIRQFYDLIVEEIGKIDPVAQKAILTRLAEIDAQYGLTIHAGV